MASHLADVELIELVGPHTGSPFQRPLQSRNQLKEERVPILPTIQNSFQTHSQPEVTAFASLEIAAWIRSIVGELGTRAQIDGMIVVGTITEGGIVIEDARHGRLQTSSWWYGVLLDASVEEVEAAKVRKRAWLIQHVLRHFERASASITKEDQELNSQGLPNHHRLSECLTSLSAVFAKKTEASLVLQSRSNAHREKFTLQRECGAVAPLEATAKREHGFSPSLEPDAVTLRWWLAAQGSDEFDMLVMGWFQRRFDWRGAKATFRRGMTKSVV
ncbi:hypothetical protein BKA70DRAFT_1223145 [Coprinopsis sp. MPI-PUGE-AT-0042]|nr:hypothetical protein BKA70DRAFT_1223145 [Coprinopsis sp. MPI-PUGE-AT-0042]